MYSAAALEARSCNKEGIVGSFGGVPLDHISFWEIGRWS
jgi:hypothetical protein